MPIHKFKFNLIKSPLLIGLGCLYLSFHQLELLANPTGLIDNFALGISRSETPKQLKAERQEPQDEPFFILQQSGNIIFQVLSNGNIEWSGTLNRQSTTKMGNLIPATDGTQLGSTESSWGKLYLNEMYFPLQENEAELLSSEKVEVTLNQLEAVQQTNNPNNIQLRLKSNQTVSVKNPKHRSFYNVSHIIPIIIKKLQDHQQKLKEQAERVTVLEQQLQDHKSSQQNLQKQKEDLLQQFQKESQQQISKIHQREQQAQQKLNLMKNEIKALKDQLKILTTSIQDKLEPKPNTSEEEKASP